MKTASSVWILGNLLLSLTAAAAVEAQIVPDSTLPNASIVEAGCTNCTIEGGTTQGGNLFHSFRDFSVPTGGSVSFNNAPQIENILTRVTGNSVSTIDGLLRANGTANLFLINPNGVIFGPNAWLNLGGSFVNSTADAIGFPSGDVFSATNPTAPTPLLNVNPNALLFNQLNSQPIINRSTANSTGLNVNDGRSLLLVGGDVRLETGQLIAPGGRIEMGGLSEPGAIELTMNNNIFSLEFPANVARADVSLVNGSLIDVSANGGGSIAITARNLNTLNGSEISAGVGRGLGTVGSQAGDIEINATGAIVIVSSGISNNVGPRSIGKGGSIRITTGSLSVTNGAQFSTSTYGRGDAGNIFIDARDTVSFNGTTPDGRSPTAAFSDIKTSGTGQGGIIRITTGSLSLTNGAQLGVGTFGRGDAGNIFIDARDMVSFDGASSNDSSGAFSSVLPSGIGQGGNIRIVTGSLSVTKGAGLTASTYGRGDAGNIFIDARDAVSFDRSGAFSIVAATGVGQGGSVHLSAGSLSLTNGGQLVSDTRGRGRAGNIFVSARSISFDGRSQNGMIASGASSSVQSSGIGQGGNIRIATGSLSLTNGAQLSVSTRGQGDAGNIFVDARDTVSSDGTDTSGRSPTGIFSSVQPTGIGRGGNIRIVTGSLSLTNGAQLGTSTFGRGDAGNIFVDARDTVSFDGTNPDDSFSSGAFSSVQLGGIGRGGNTRITTGFLLLTNGGQLASGTRGRGDAGNIFVDARNSISFDGRSRNGRSRSSALSVVTSTAIGQGGDIRLITADSLTVANGATLSASSSGTGKAGNISTNAPYLRLDQGSITSETASGNGGNIDLTVQDILLLRRGGFISTTAGNAQAGGDGGNIRFKGGFVVAVPSENSDITANAFTGRGGRVDVTTQGIFGIETRPRVTPLSDITASSDFGIAGTILLNTLNLDPSQSLTALPTDLTDASNLIAIGCTSPAAAQANRGEFYQTGRGGIAPSPTDTLSSSDILEDLQPPNAWTTATTPVPIQEAQGWQRSDRGEIILVASTQRHCGH